MIYTSGNNKSAATAHTTVEFILQGTQNKDHLGYSDLAYTEERDNLEYCVKSAIDDYIYEINQMAVTVNLPDNAVIKYRFNPKLMSYDLYKTTRLYYLILRLNGLANVHDFNLESHKIKLLEVVDMNNVLSTIYKTEAQALTMYNNTHKGLVTEKEINKYWYVPDGSKRFLYM